MRDIYIKLVELFEKNRFGVLATIIGQTGSAPRGVGTCILIMEDGSSAGTIGGGILEASVIEEAKEVFDSKIPLRYRQILSGTDIAKSDMICGGDVEVFLEPVSPDNFNHLHLFESVMEVRRRGGSGLLATVVDTDRWHGMHIPKMFLHPGGERIGSLIGVTEVDDAVMSQMELLLAEKQPRIIGCMDNEGNSLSIFAEPIMSDPILYVFGGGHVSLQIVPLAHRVGFKVTVIDDRPEFSNPQRFPEADDVYNYPFDGVFERLSVNESSYLVIVTRGHLHDKTVLSQCLRTDAGYIGMIGSRRKNAIIYRKLIDEGFSQKDIDRVHAPIGLKIGAETPEEIAISIVAELIKVRAGCEVNV
jgi:xanthine dehydrogenase accessory factor